MSQGVSPCVLSLYFKNRFSLIYEIVSTGNSDTTSKYIIVEEAEDAQWCSLRVQQAVRLDDSPSVGR